MEAIPIRANLNGAVQPGAPPLLLCPPPKVEGAETPKALGTPTWVLLEDATHIADEIAEEQAAQLREKEAQLEVRPKCGIAHTFYKMKWNLRMDRI